MFKKLSIFDKLVAIVNALLATILLISFSSYYISPNSISFISIISLSVPILILLNIVFIIYWVLKLKRQFLVSTIVLLVGFQYVSTFYRFSEKKILLTDDVKLMTYNVRMFNLYNWIEEENIPQKTVDFIELKDPDILCLQEFHTSKKAAMKFPFKYEKITNATNHSGQVIYSKFKIINSGSLNFSNSSNNAIFIDILKNKDTLRIYNVHLESLRINPKEEELTQENSEKLRIRLEKGFKVQTNQANLILQHQAKINYKSVICGDFNNTAFSWVYKQLKKGKNDAFEEAGSSFGKTYDFPFPLRIDFILTDKNIEINNFKTYNIKYSDHYPIMARLNF